MTQLHRQSAGFTLIELMVTIAVLGILVGLAVPAFNDIIRTNRLAAQTNNLVGSLNLARAEASKRGLPVSVCAATADQSECAAANTADWANGWLVFTDRMGDIGQYDAGEGNDELLQVSAAVGQAFSLTTDNLGFVRFGPGSTPATEVTFTVRPVATTGCIRSGRREVAIARTGRINTTKVDCS